MGSYLCIFRAHSSLTNYLKQTDVADGARVSVFDGGQVHGETLSRAWRKNSKTRYCSTSHFLRRDRVGLDLRSDCDVSRTPN